MSEFNESVKPLRSRSLHAFNIPLSDMFQSLEPYDIMKEKKTYSPPRYFLSVQGENRRYYVATLTPSFDAWIRGNTFNDSGKHPCSFEFIQQSAGNGKYEDEFLVLAEESQILGSTWLDYRDKAEIEAFLG